MAGTKKNARKLFSIVFTVALICLMTAAIIPGVMGYVSPAPVNLGNASNFAILAETGVGDGSPVTSHITGDVGVHTIGGTFITGVSCTEVIGTIYDNNGGYTGGHDLNFTCRVTNATLLEAARLDMEAAYTNATAQLPNYINGAAEDIGGQILTPGVYQYGGAVTIPTDLTLNAQGNADAVWIFQIAGALTISADKKVILSNGSQAKNIFWAVAGATTLEANSVLYGNILDKTTITLGSNATLNGRALAQTTVTLGGSTVTRPPSADFTFTPASGPAYLNVTFTDTSTPAVTITSRAWTFGDGGSSSETNPTHKYLVPGTRSVTLTITDVNGGSDTKTQTVLVTQPSFEITLINVPISLTLTPGATTTNTTSQFSVTSTVNWQVTAKDTDGTTLGYMTNYSVSGTQYGSPATQLNQRFKVLDSTSQYVALPSGAEASVVFKTGTPEASGTAYPLGVQQEVKMTDPRLPGSNVYRIVVTLTVGSL